MNASTIEDALLRLFLRHRVPPLPRDYQTACLAHQRQLRDLERRANLDPGQDGFISAGAFPKEVEKLNARFEQTGDRILHDPQSYRYWTPTAEDWKNLAIRQAIADAGPSQSKRAPRDGDKALQAPVKKRGVGNPGSDLWRQRTIVENAYLEALADDTIPKGKKRQAAATKASTYITDRRKAGDSVGAISAASIVTGWKKYLPDGVEHTHQPPDYITGPMERDNHERNVWNAANKLGLAKQLMPQLSEFLAWAYERVAPRNSGLDMFPPLSSTEVTTWRDYEEALASMPSKYREEYDRLFADYEALTS